ncbi:nucleoside deaminase [Myceligenerans crystallogenes]|uniref:Nucleoside deaminase n=1 Tax=Myceligenerans crystallogenes TaxID=316335 RepID=A0ABN2NG28_9MICO
MTDADDRWLARAVALATENVAGGGGPFGAVVVLDDAEVAAGANDVTGGIDPTAHAEVVAIRRACRALGTHSLAGATLYASCEPCPMCLSAALWARVDRLVFAADRRDAAAAGFDDSLFYDLLSGARQDWPTALVPLRIDVAPEPFAAWQASGNRREY